LLSSKSLRMQLVKEELLTLKEKYGDQRRTKIFSTNGKDTFKKILKEEEMVLAISNMGFIQRIPLSEYQKDKSVFNPSKRKDFIEYLFKTANSHHLLCFTNKGRCYSIRSSFIPQSHTPGEGVDIRKIIGAKNDEIFVNFIEISKFDVEQFIFLATQFGLVKRIALSDLVKIHDGGLPVLTLKDNDRLFSVALTSGKDQIIIATAEGKAIRFSEEDVRDMGLSAMGVRGINLEKNDYIIGMTPVSNDNDYLFSITNIGYGKKSQLKEYSVIKRGGKGIVNYKVTQKVGKVVSILAVKEKDQILLITKKLKRKRLQAKDVKVMGRATQGMILANLTQGDEIARAMFFPTLK